MFSALLASYILRDWDEQAAALRISAASGAAFWHCPGPVHENSKTKTPKSFLDSYAKPTETDHKAM